MRETSGQLSLDREVFLELLGELFAEQQLAVLSTTRGDRPYLNLVAFTASEDKGSLYFATPRATRKHENILHDPRVAFLIDSRTNQSLDFKEALAVTVFGTAMELTGSERDAVAAGYVRKFPHLEEFVGAPTCALMKVSVTRYSLVRRFQDVVELDMG